MTDADRFKLLHAPYKPQPLRRGDRATCLFRDGDVVITSWSDARLPWPRCRRADSTGGGSGLLVDEELLRACARNPRWPCNSGGAYAGRPSGAGGRRSGPANGRRKARGDSTGR